MYHSAIPPVVTFSVTDGLTEFSLTFLLYTTFFYCWFTMYQRMAGSLEWYSSPNSSPSNHSNPLQHSIHHNPQPQPRHHPHYHPPAWQIPRQGLLCWRNSRSRHPSWCWRIFRNSFCTPRATCKITWNIHIYRHTKIILNDLQINTIRLQSGATILISDEMLSNFPSRISCIAKSDRASTYKYMKLYGNVHIDHYNTIWYTKLSRRSIFF